jgi:hypothetical protein
MTSISRGANIGFTIEELRTRLLYLENGRKRYVGNPRDIEGNAMLLQTADETVRIPGEIGAFKPSEDTLRIPGEEGSIPYLTIVGFSFEDLGSVSEVKERLLANNARQAFIMEQEICYMSRRR